MKLVPGECVYSIPDCGMIDSVVLDEGVREMRGYRYPLYQISPGEWQTIRGDTSKPPVRARPVYYAWFAGQQTLRLYPAPDAAHDLDVRYYSISTGECYLMHQDDQDEVHSNFWDRDYEFTRQSRDLRRLRWFLMVVSVALTVAAIAVLGRWV